MKLQNKIRDRIQIGVRVSESDYIKGIIYILNYLFQDYEKCIVFEGRLKGVMLVYRDEINLAMYNLLIDLSDEEYDHCCRIVYLFKGLIYREYRKLIKARLSKADAILVIIKRILEFLDEEGQFVEYIDLGEINAIVNQLYNNIRWRTKGSKLKGLMMNLKDFYSSGSIGRFVDSEFSVIEEENKYLNKSELKEGSKTLLEDPGETTQSITEVGF